MTTNPYKSSDQAPDVPVATVPVTSRAIVDPHPMNRSRTAIVLVAFIFASISAVSFFGFAYNLTINYPGTEIPVIQHDPVWMVFHLIRGFGLGYLSILLWTYQNAIKNWPLRTSEDENLLSDIHNDTWTFGAFFLILNFAISFGYEFAPQWVRHN